MIRRVLTEMLLMDKSAEAEAVSCQDVSETVAHMCAKFTTGFAGDWRLESLTVTPILDSTFSLRVLIVAVACGLKTVA